MAFLYETRAYTKTQKEEAVSVLVENAVPNRDFYLLVIGAALFALFGIALDSIPVLIGAMIVAPLASPILALGLGVVAGNMRLMMRSALTLLAASVTAAVVAAVAAYFFPQFDINGAFISFTAHPFYDIAIAVVAGAIAAYGAMRVKVGNALTGIGIAVSLMPPLVASSLALGRFNIDLFREALYIFLFNVGGILAGSIVMFTIFGIGSYYKRQ